VPFVATARIPSGCSRVYSSFSRVDPIGKFMTAPIMANSAHTSIARSMYGKTLPVAGALRRSSSHPPIVKCALVQTWFTRLGWASSGTGAGGRRPLNACLSEATHAR